MSKIICLQELTGKIEKYLRINKYKYYFVLINPENNAKNRRVSYTHPPVKKSVTI